MPDPETDRTGQTLRAGRLTLVVVAAGDPAAARMLQNRTLSAAPEARMDHRGLMEAGETLYPAGA